LAAAQALRSGGRVVQIVEALPRIGGRAYTDATALGLPIDLGAATLEATDTNPLYRIARTLGFTTSPSDWDEMVFVNGRPGDARDRAAYEKAVETVFDLLHEAGEAEIDTDAAQALLERWADPWVRTAAAVMGVADEGVELSEMSCADWLAIGHEEPFAAIREGVGTLVQRLADGMPIAVNAAVSAIRATGNGVAVETLKGTLRARAVIVTVSPGVLASGAIALDPAPPLELQTALDALKMGRIEKIAMRFDPKSPALAFPANTILTPQITDERAMIFHVGPQGRPLIVQHVGGDWAKTVTDAGPKIAIGEALAALRAIIGNNSVKGFKAAVATAWGNDPRFLGAHACAKPGLSGRRQALPLPIADGVWLAGEALGQTRAQSLDGAWASGRKTAETVMRELRKKSGEP
jgi:monoamine oxidase